MKTLRLILGDQLNHQHSWYSEANDDITYVMMEVRQETDYVPHHIQKVVGFFTAMRAFAEEKKYEGHQFIYYHLNDVNNNQSIPDNLDFLIREHGFEKFEYQLPDEYRLDQQLHEYCQSLNIDWETFDTEHFYTKRDELASFFKGKKIYLMESFYRHMRKKHDVMMDGKNPIGGKWNFDHSNRKAFPKDIQLPNRGNRKKDVSEILKMIKKSDVKTIGSIDEKNFIWPVTREEALDDLHTFCTQHLKNFGNYQDAMSTESAFGFHSLLSFAMNVKLISPSEVVNTVVEYWQQHEEDIDISAVEGFVRQIIGWREYMRGIYWAKMPEYAELNALKHQNKLPEWFWTGDTKMSCLRHAIGQSLDHALRTTFSG